MLLKLTLRVYRFAILIIDLVEFVWNLLKYFCSCLKLVRRVFSSPEPKELNGEIAVVS